MVAYQPGGDKSSGNFPNNLKGSGAADRGDAAPDLKALGLQWLAFVPCYRAIRKLPHVTEAGQVVHALLAFLQAKAPHCEPTIRLLAKLAGVSTKTIERGIANLRRVWVPGTRRRILKVRRSGPHRTPDYDLWVPERGGWFKLPFELLWRRGLPLFSRFHLAWLLDCVDLERREAERAGRPAPQPPDGANCAYLQAYPTRGKQARALGRSIRTIWRSGAGLVQAGEIALCCDTARRYESCLLLTHNQAATVTEVRHRRDRSTTPVSYFCHTPCRTSVTPLIWFLEILAREKTPDGAAARAFLAQLAGANGSPPTPNQPSSVASLPKAETLKPAGEEPSAAPGDKAPAAGRASEAQRAILREQVGADTTDAEIDEVVGQLGPGWDFKDAIRMLRERKAKLEGLAAKYVPLADASKAVEQPESWMVAGASGAGQKAKQVERRPAVAGKQVQSIGEILPAAVEHGGAAGSVEVEGKKPVEGVAKGPDKVEHVEAVERVEGAAPEPAATAERDGQERYRESVLPVLRLAQRLGYDVFGTGDYLIAASAPGCPVWEVGGPDKLRCPAMGRRRIFEDMRRRRILSGQHAAELLAGLERHCKIECPLLEAYSQASAQA